MSKKLPNIGDKIKFKDINPSKKGVRILEGTVTKVSKRFGGIIYLTDISSKDEFITRLENILK